MTDFVIKFPKEDMTALQKSMNRLESDLGKSHKSALRMTAYQILKSAGAATRVSPQYRPYTRKKKSRRKGKQTFVVDMSYAPKSLIRYAKSEGLKMNGNDLFLTADSVSKLKKSGFVKIGGRGTAKYSWAVIGKKARVASTASGQRVSGVGAIKNRARKYVGWKQKFDSNEQYIQMSNNIEYIEKAIKGGENGFMQIAGKAARGLEKTIEKTLEKRAKKI